LFEFHGSDINKALKCHGLQITRDRFFQVLEYFDPVAGTHRFDTQGRDEFFVLTDCLNVKVERLENGVLRTFRNLGRSHLQIITDVPLDLPDCCFAVLLAISERFVVPLLAFLFELTPVIPKPTSKFIGLHKGGLLIKFEGLLDGQNLLIGPELIDLVEGSFVLLIDFLKFR